MGEFFQQGVYRKIYRQPSGYAASGRDFKRCKADDRNRENIVKIGDISYIQVHPLFIYESLWCFFLLCVLLIYTKRKKFQGEIFMRYLAGYALGKAGIEFLCTDRICIPGTEISAFVPVLAGIFGDIQHRCDCKAYSFQEA